MRKGIKTKKLSRTTNERKQLFRNLIKQVLDRGFVETSVTKAKVVRKQVEKLVTHAKKKSLASLRYLVSKTGDITTANKLLDYGALFSKRPGGYTRIVKLHIQKGDDTQMAKLEFVESLIVGVEVKSSQPKTDQPLAKKLAKTSDVKLIEEKTSIKAKPKKIKSKAK